jgi:hypothetical protein
MPRLAVALALGLGALAAGCSAVEPPGTSPRSTVQASSSLAPVATPGGSGAASIVIDSELLTVLPTTIGGLAITESREGETDALADPVLPTIATAAAAAVAVDAGPANLVYVLVVRLLPGSMTEDRFRDWRDSYDEGACGGPGAVVGHAESPIDDLAVFIGTCSSGDLRTYHVWIADSNLLITAASSGQKRLGELLMGELRL